MVTITCSHHSILEHSLTGIFSLLAIARYEEDEWKLLACFCQCDKMNSDGLGSLETEILCLIIARCSSAERCISVHSPCSMAEPWAAELTFCKQNKALRPPSPCLVCELLRKKHSCHWVFVTGAVSGVDWEFSLGNSFPWVPERKQCSIHSGSFTPACIECHRTLQKAVGFQVCLHLALGLIFWSLMSVMLYFSCENSKNPIPKTRELSKTVNFIPMFGVLRYFIGKESKKVLQRILQHPGFREDTLHRILVCGHKLYSLNIL